MSLISLVVQKLKAFRMTVPSLVLALTSGMIFAGYREEKTV